MFFALSFLLCVKWEEEADESEKKGNETADVAADNSSNEFGSHVNKQLSYASSALTICFVIEVCLRLTIRLFSH